MTDYDCLRRAYELALKGQGCTSPNPMVGAVFVRNKKIIGEGWHRRCGGDHAEVAALKKIKGNAKKAKLYVTFEPCHHFGRTPPCVDQLILSGVKEVVIGMKDPNPLTNGKSISKLKRAGIKVNVFHPRSENEKLLQQQIEEMNAAFVKYVKFEMPFVVTKTAQTLDGKIATQTGHSKWITSQKSRDYAHRLRNNFDAIVVGSNTVLKDNPGLNATKKSKRLKKIVLDSSLRMSPQAKLLKDICPSDCYIATTKKAASSRVASWRKNGVNVIVCPQKQGRVHLRWLMEELASRGIINILIEGGAQVVGTALKEKLVDRMLIFLAPKILGSQQALSAIDGLDVAHVDQAIHFKHVNITSIGKDFLLEGSF